MHAGGLFLGAVPLCQTAVKYVGAGRQPGREVVGVYGAGQIDSLQIGYASTYCQVSTSAVIHYLSAGLGSPVSIGLAGLALH